MRTIPTEDVKKIIAGLRLSEKEKAEVQKQYDANNPNIRFSIRGIWLRNN